MGGGVAGDWGEQMGRVEGKLIGEILSEAVRGMSWKQTGTLKKAAILSLFWQIQAGPHPRLVFTNPPRGEGGAL